MAGQLLLASSAGRVRLIALFETLKGMLALALALGFGVMASFDENLQEAAQELVLGAAPGPLKTSARRVPRSNQQRASRSDLDRGHVGRGLLLDQVLRGVRSLERTTLGSMGFCLERWCLPAHRGVRAVERSVLVPSNSGIGECSDRPLHGRAVVAIATKFHIGRSRTALRRECLVQEHVKPWPLSGRPAFAT